MAWVSCVLKRVVAPVVLLTLVSCGSKIELYRDLSAREANQMLASLMRQGIHAERATDSRGNVSLSVPTQDLPRAMDVLDSAGLPREHFADLATLFSKEGMISSPTEERVRFIYGTTQELSRTLTSIDGVLNARVHAVLPENADDDLNTPSPSSAGVLVRYTPGAPIDQIVPKIKELVANSLEGLSYDRVSVVLVEAHQDDTSVGPVDGAASPTEGSDRFYLLMGLVGGMAVLLTGNVALALLLWRRRFRRTPLGAVP
ncbi:type III secretion inner membrane ring lipoprotein SctJ [Sinorhizobium sp. 7-81]|uniref:type III secretion system inner membrane ring lipoprotein SctJ n=1 Tax=Sinorhizobium sp. 8-89 TaxID=3049089 RepID=UPI0024C2D4BE|nr:type III secretion inner membrane ring lipoprotein SctJ [Sinorhizobium sp. 8-89]MDK1492975.1 type III secretion inner membrane ring lipoprotein SctJ [Sinorhizobium sp. 8-89]